MQVDVIKRQIDYGTKLSNLQIYVNVFINIIYIKFGGKFATYTLNN